MTSLQMVRTRRGAADLTGTPLYEIRTPAMSTWARIRVVGGDAGMAEDARARLLDLAARWDARVPGEIARVNSSAGRSAAVSPETVLLVGLALRAADETGGAYDPRALPAFLPGSGPLGTASARWRDRFAVDPRSGTVGLPAGCTLDLGGVDRGLAADLVVADTLDAGAYGVCVEVGGQVRAAGAAPSRQGWTVSVEHPLALAPVGELLLRTGAVATSTRTLPAVRSGERTRLLAVTVVAAAAWHAKALARGALRAGHGTGRDLVESAGAAALFFLADGRMQPTESWGDFLA